MSLHSLFQTLFASGTRLPLMGDEGVVTSATRDTFVPMQIMLSSLVARHAKMRVLVIDQGMTAEQRRWCEDYQELMVVSPAADFLYKFPQQQEEWNKPRYFTLSPFNASIWLSPTTFVMGTLNEPFCGIRSKAFIVQANDWLPHDTRLYERLQPRNKPNQTRRLPNTGLVGLLLSRDNALLRDWTLCVHHAASASTVRETVLNTDAGALTWALVNCGRPWLCDDRPLYNRRLPRSTFSSPENFFHYMREQYTDNSVAHFEHRYWERWGVDILPLSLV